MDPIGDGAEVKKRNITKNKRKRFLKDENAPKKPVNGYVLFMNARRESVTKQNQHLCFADVTKLLGEEWSSMNETQRSIYLATAEKEKEIYKKKMEEYKKTEAYKNFLERKGDIKQPSPDRPEPKSSADTKSTLKSFEGVDKKQNNEIPIFTEQFLDYNKAKEGELHQINKANMAYEKQNIVLDKHVSNLKNAVEKLDQEIEEQSNKNSDLEHKLSSFRLLLIEAFSEIRLPFNGKVPNFDNIDSYIDETCTVLQGMACEKSFVTAVQDVMTKVNFQTMDVSWEEYENKPDV